MTARIGMVPRSRLLPAAHHQPAEERSLLLEMLTRVIHPSVLVVAAYLFVVGADEPGGGFAAGLMAGLGLVLRRTAGGPWELGAASPIPPGGLLGAGLVVLAGYGVAGVLLAGELLGGVLWHVDAGPLGEAEVPSGLIFEAGIVLIVVGLVVDIARTLGGSDRPDQPAETGSGGGP